jgi:hypothetical protein
VRGIVDDIEIFTEIEAADTMDLVQGALDRYGLLPGDTDVRVTASDHTVTITGHVKTWGEHDAVIDAAWRGVGVNNVCDDLVVTGLPERLTAHLIQGEHCANPTVDRWPAVGASHLPALAATAYVS